MQLATAIATALLGGPILWLPTALLGGLTMAVLFRQLIYPNGQSTPRPVFLIWVAAVTLGGSAGLLIRFLASAAISRIMQEIVMAGFWDTLPSVIGYAVAGGLIGAMGSSTLEPSARQSDERHENAA